MSAVPRPPEPELAARLRELFAGWSEDSLRETLGAPFGITPLLDGELYERRLRDDSSRAATLAKLLVLGASVPASDAPPILVEAGLAEPDGELVRPLVQLVPHEGLLVASDAGRSSQPEDSVAGVSPSAIRVARLAIRRPVGSILDLGAGGGIQGLLAAPHAKRVVAVDVNERALSFTRFNAALNGLSNLETRAGNWLEPVVGERFDLVVANPPYVVSPETALLYRDGTLMRDDVTQALLRGIPAHLVEGGFAQVMGNWIHGREEDWRDPIEGWLAGSGCDALLLRYLEPDLVAYAALWNWPHVAQGREPYLEAVDRWLDYYRSEGIEAISDGMVILRRRSGGRNWVRAIEVPRAPAHPAGEHVLRLVEARDRRDDIDYASARFALAPGVKLSRGKLEPENGVGFAAELPADVGPTLDSLDPALARRLFALGLIVVESELHAALDPKE